MTNDPALLHRLADHFFNAIASGDSATIQEIYDPLVQVWHNHDDNTQGLAENLRLLAFMARKITDFAYINVSREIFADGFVQRHSLSGRVGTHDILAHTCTIAHVRDGRITRLYDYMDTAQVAALMTG